MGICPSAVDDGQPGCIPAEFFGGHQQYAVRSLHNRYDSAGATRTASNGLGNPQDGARGSKAGPMSSSTRHTKELRMAYSESIIDTWGHRDIPLEIEKVYEIRQLIGEGTTSQVFLAIRRTDDMPFACKVVDKHMLPHDNGQRAAILHQLKKEIEVLRLLDHPNIIRYEGMVETSKKIYCFMEYVHGCELYEYLLHNGPMDQETTAHLTHSLMNAVAHMHDRGIIHRDIKAENVMLAKPHPGSTTPVPKLIDFGFATILNYSVTNSFLGTAGYLAPEIRQERCYYRSVDIWAMGILVYLTLSCRLPFDRELAALPKNVETLKGQFTLAFREEVWETDHEEVKELLGNMLAIQPAKRWNARECLRHAWLSGDHFGKQFAADSPPPSSPLRLSGALRRGGHSPLRPGSTHALPKGASAMASMSTCISVPRFDVLVDDAEQTLSSSDNSTNSSMESKAPLCTSQFVGPRTM